MIYYLTSFNDVIFQHSGRFLLDSFIQSNSDGALLSASETTHYYTTYRLLGNKLLENWFKNNPDIIPESLGGKQKPCRCNNNPEEKIKEKFHKKGCHYTYWNKHVHRWMKKVASLGCVLDLKTDYLVWLDADCKFLQKVPESYIAERLSGYDVFYFRGKKRDTDETGIVGYNFNRRGKEMIQRCLDKYTDRSFRKETRWDDCYNFGKIRIKYNFKGNDLAANAITTDPIPESEFSKYICHYKGTHRKAGLL